MNDDDLARRYREASAELDERPAASARAAILAAAAREVGAKPTDAAKYRRRRWPLAAAAAIMLSTLAVMLAIRTGDEMPQFSAPPAPARSAVEEAPAAPPAPPTADSTQREQAVKDRRSPARTEPRTRSDSGVAPQKPREMDRAAPPAATAPANTPAPVPSTPSPKTSAAIDEAATGAADRARSMEQAAGSEARRDAARESPASQRAAQSELDATAWLERIIKLRRDGRNDEADAELKRFRERYPQVQVPSEAVLR